MKRWPNKYESYFLKPSYKHLDEEVAWLQSCKSGFVSASFALERIGYIPAEGIRVSTVVNKLTRGSLKVEARLVQLKVKFSAGGRKSIEIPITIGTESCATDGEPSNAEMKFTELTASNYQIPEVAACCTCIIIPLVMLGIFGMFGLSIAEIGAGAKYLHDCPKEKLIPIYLIVMGVCAILLFMCEFSSFAVQIPKDNDGIINRYCHVLSGIVGVFLLAWFICGHVWVFSNGDYTTVEKDINGTAIESFCNSTLYTFAWWSIILRWIVVAYVGLFAYLCWIFFGACCSAMCFAREDYETNNPNAAGNLYFFKGPNYFEYKLATDQVVGSTNRITVQDFFQC